MATGEVIGVNEDCLRYLESNDLQPLSAKEGRKVPGYQGHCPLLRYDFGKSFGQGTYDAYQAMKNKEPESVDVLSKPRTKSDLHTSQEKIVTKKGLVRNALPPSNGENKYTEQMVPGYTGYIPGQMHQLGNTYKEECDICLGEHFSKLRHQDTVAAEAMESFKSSSTLSAVKQNPELKDRLEEYGKILSVTPTIPRQGVYRPPVLEKEWELPVCSYVGYIPRVRVTEIGLGDAYREGTKDGLDDFYAEHARRSVMLASFKTSPSQDSSAKK